MTSSLPDIYDTFKGKNVFFTGVTGFVGKVFLYKLLKEFPDIGNVYCLCRGKKGVSMEDRFTNGVLSSPCFFPLIKDIGETEWKRRAAKCKAIPGDITHHRLGINDDDYKEITENVNIIVHLAATVDFHEKLNLSAEMNILGSVRVMSMAQKCRLLESYIHTSTCYVNWNRHSSTIPVKEELYPLPFDPETMLKYILSLNNDQVASETKRLQEQYNFPNTYTLTKTMTEHILMRQRGNLPLVIVRPAVIGCSWREPYNGWVDALTAAGGLFLTTGLGLVHELEGRANVRADVVPVDYVVNLIFKVTHRSILYHKPTSYGTVAEPQSINLLVNSSNVSYSENVALIVAANNSKNVSATGTPVPPANNAGSQLAMHRRQQMLTSELPSANVSSNSNGSATAAALAAVGSGTSDPGALTAKFPRIYQSCTSATMNPLTWQVTMTAVAEFWNDKKHPKSLGKSGIVMIPNRRQWKTQFYLKRILPVKAMIAVGESGIPGLVSPKQVKLLKKYLKATNRVRDLNRQFSPFTLNEWFFEATNAAENLDEPGCIGLSPRAQKAFNTDIFEINWFSYVYAYNWGIMTFIMKEKDHVQPTMPASGAEQWLRASL